MMRATFLVLTLAVMIFGLAACNTVQGAGRDVQEAGDAIEDSAD